MECNICNKFYSSVYNLKRHKIMMHENPSIVKKSENMKCDDSEMSTMSEEEEVSTDTELEMLLLILFETVSLIKHLVRSK